MQVTRRCAKFRNSIRHSHNVFGALRNSRGGSQVGHSRLQLAPAPGSTGTLGIVIMIIVTAAAASADDKTHHHYLSLSFSLPRCLSLISFFPLLQHNSRKSELYKYDEMRFETKRNKKVTICSFCATNYCKI